MDQDDMIKKQGQIIDKQIDIIYRMMKLLYAEILGENAEPAPQGSYAWEPDIDELAEKYWKDGDNLGSVMVYASPYGEHRVLPVSPDTAQDAISYLQAMKLDK